MMLQRSHKKEASTQRLPATPYFFTSIEGPSLELVWADFHVPIQIEKSQKGERSAQDPVFQPEKFGGLNDTGLPG